MARRREAQRGSEPYAHAYTRVPRGHVLTQIGIGIEVQARIIRNRHGQRIYAYFNMAAEPADDRAVQAQLIATLAGAGYKAAAEAVSEMAGFEVREVEQPPMMTGGMMTNRAPLPAPQEAPPLTEDELAAFASLATPNPDRMAQRQREVEAALRAAADLPDVEEVQNREPSLLEKLLIKNSGPGGEDCEAKSEETCRCAPSDWKPITLPNRMNPQEARARLAQGVKVTNPLGEEVTLNNELLNHWAREGKSEDMINARLSALPLIEEVVKNPAEIWENENGSRTYLASVLDPYRQNGKSYTVAFTKAADNTTLETYHIGSTSIGSKRKGKQLYP